MKNMFFTQLRAIIVTDFVTDSVADHVTNVYVYKSVGKSFGVTQALSLCPTKRFPHRQKYRPTFPDKKKSADFFTYFCL